MYSTSVCSGVYGKRVSQSIYHETNENKDRTEKKANHCFKFAIAASRTSGDGEDEWASGWDEICGIRNSSNPDIPDERKRKLLSLSQKTVDMDCLLGGADPAFIRGASADPD